MMTVYRLTDEHGKIRYVGQARSPHVRFMKIPEHARRAGETSRQFRQRKRAELKALIVAFEKFRRACAYVPAYQEVAVITSSLNTLQTACRVNNWDRRSR